MYIVIGSGPAAIAATQALVSQGRSVTILDVGTRLEPERQAVVDRMSAQDAGLWEAQDIETVAGKRRSASEAVNHKRVYGSSYGFDTRSEAVGVRWRKCAGFNHSLALGGLSNVWGAALLSYRQADIAGWPITLEDLQPHYRAVMDFVPGTNVSDGLEDILPAYSSHANPLEPSRQGHALLKDMEARKDSLRQSGIFFGRSRLAIRAAGDSTRRACAYCALCLSGCPYGLIYSSAQTLNDLVQSGRIKYLQDHLVEMLEDLGDEVRVTGRRLSDNGRFAYQAKRVFVGTGVLPTAKIILNSLQVFDHPVRLLDSQYFIYPLLRMAMTDGVETEKMHTSSQVFMEIDDKRISDHLVHLQIYGYSALLHNELDRTFLGWPLRVSAFRRHFLGRLLIAQGFLHSKESGALELTLQRSVDGQVCLDVQTRHSRKALATTLRVGWKLLQQAMRLRAVPLLPGLKFPPPGNGYHSGGSFPMRRQPQALETDCLGRLPAMARVHLVDASVLPSIPATSITLSMMANSHRIATMAGQLDLP
jgi:choline dehydrogenase-like flavoprotein